MGTLLAKVHQILLVFTAGNSKPIGKDENLLPFFRSSEKFNLFEYRKVTKIFIAFQLAHQIKSRKFLYEPGKWIVKSEQKEATQNIIYYQVKHDLFKIIRFSRMYVMSESKMNDIKCIICFLTERCNYVIIYIKLSDLCVQKKKRLNSFYITKFMSSIYF